MTPRSGDTTPGDTARGHAAGDSGTVAPYRAAQLKAEIPVMSRPTSSAWMKSVPS